MSTPPAVVSSPPPLGGLDVDLPGADVRLRATRWPGSGTPVLLLHGLASTRRFWDLVVPGLAGLPVLALDQRGHGDSDRPDGPYDAQTVVADALTALDAVGGLAGGGGRPLVGCLDGAAAGRDGAVPGARRGGGRRRHAAGPVPGVTPESMRVRMTPPRTALPLDELLAMLRSGPLAPWWSPAVEAAVLPIFGVGADGLARARLPFEAHMAIVDDLLAADLEPVLAAVRCPAWLVSCSPDADRAAALERTAALLAQPRAQRWEGAVHDVPLQWPALVAGLVRAAVDEVSVRSAGEGAPA
jgi:pimeloyl-ACP methyl ester carboxylesterase